MKIKSLAGGIIEKREGWRVCKYKRWGDRFPTFKARRTSKVWKLPFDVRYNIAKILYEDNPDQAKLLLRWCIMK